MLRAHEVNRWSSHCEYIHGSIWLLILTILDNVQYIEFPKDVNLDSYGIEHKFMRCGMSHLKRIN